MATIEARTTRTGTTVYRVKIRRRGLPVRSTTFPDRKAAQAWAQGTEAALLAQRALPLAYQHTLAEAIDRYLREVLPRKSRASETMQTIQLRWWRNWLGDRPLAALTPGLVTTWRETLARGDQGTPRAPATVNRYLAVLSHVCTIAVREWEWLDANPVQKVRKLREPRGRVRCLTDPERARLLAACQASAHPYLYPVVVLALSTGARKMELLTLTWQAVDLQRGRIILHDTKNTERRAVPLVGHALALVQQLVQACRQDTPLLFPRPDGRKPLRLEYAWQRALQQAAIHDFRFHDLRHSAASYLAMNGANLMEIAVVLGHKTLDMVRRYAHLTDAHLDGVVRGMNAKIFEHGETRV